VNKKVLNSLKNILFWNRFNCKCQLSPTPVWFKHPESDIRCCTVLYYTTLYCIVLYCILWAGVGWGGVGWKWIHLVRRPLVGPLYSPGWWMSLKTWWKENCQEEPKYSEETCPSVTSCTKTLPWPDLGSKSGRCGEKPATNRTAVNRNIGVSWTILTPHTNCSDMGLPKGIESSSEMRAFCGPCFFLVHIVSAVIIWYRDPKDWTASLPAYNGLIVWNFNYFRTWQRNEVSDFFMFVCSVSCATGHSTACDGSRLVNFFMDYSFLSPWVRNQYYLYLINLCGNCSCFIRIVHKIYTNLLLH
jgi:hypothetical protein